jgi:uncharacterized radical SAM protein YgiQ
MSRPEMHALGWDALDVLLLSGDAYVDHPSFGVALLGRLLQSRGFRVGIVAQPRWESPDAALDDIRRMGRPRLFAGVTAGAIDSMLAHYTAFRKKRGDDAYTPGGKAGARPNRACIVYTGLLRQAFPGLPVVLGGIEASLRRAVHYDFWTDKLRRPILLDSKADLLIYGMGESALLGVAERARLLAAQTAPVDGDPRFRQTLQQACRDLPGVAWLAPDREVREWLRDAAIDSPLELPDMDVMTADPSLLLRASLDMEAQVHEGTRHAIQRCGDRSLVLNPPAPPLTETQMDGLYDLPYTRLPHPSYREAIPAWEMIRTSITTHRGCGGGCSFCSLALHQGRRMSSRSRQSILAEARRIADGPGGKTPRWAGSISDVGGPSANMWRARCALPPEKICKRPSCLHPALCPFFQVDQGQGVRLLREIAALPGVRHVRVASGVRFDLALGDPQALAAYTAEFTGGQLKVAPEHSEDAVLRLMRKPSMQVFERFLGQFARAVGKSHKELYTVPYLMSAFPGCTDNHMRALSTWLRERRWSPKQVQCFIPTPGTVATAMYYSGLAPDGSPIYVARSDKDRLRQHHILLGNDDSRKKPDQKTRKGRFS